jgi:hypothetical protein
MADLPADLVAYVDEVRNDSIHAYRFLEETGTLSASRIFGVAHRAREHDALINVRFPPPWAKAREPKVTIAKFSDQPDHILTETRLEADTLIHVHTPYLAAWSLAHKPFPILYVAAQRHLLAREIPNHLERTRSVLEVIRERLDSHPELAPPPALLESNGGVNFWGAGVLHTAELILLVEEAARFQAIAEQIGGAQVYTPGALDLQWKRTGLLERARAYAG